MFVILLETMLHFECFFMAVSKYGMRKDQKEQEYFLCSRNGECSTCFLYIRFQLQNNNNRALQSARQDPLLFYYKRYSICTVLQSFSSSRNQMTISISVILFSFTSCTSVMVLYTSNSYCQHKDEISKIKNKTRQLLSRLPWNKNKTNTGKECQEQKTNNTGRKMATATEHYRCLSYVVRSSFFGLSYMRVDVLYAYPTTALLLETFHISFRTACEL